MALDTLTYVLSHVTQNIPPELLTLAFKPSKYNTTVEQRIIAEIIEGPVILDTNLVGGKRRDLFLRPEWKMDLDPSTSGQILGTGVESSYYLVPPEAREHRNITSVIGLTPFLTSTLPGSGIHSNNNAGYGNTATGMLSEMLNSRTFAAYPTPPQVVLEGTNIIRFYPEQLVEGIPVTVMLEYDADFLNLNQSAIVALQRLVLCATQRYIGNVLRVSIDETEVVAGMEIGVMKDLVIDYAQKGEQYHDLLMRFKGAMHYDRRNLSRLIYQAL